MSGRPAKRQSARHPHAARRPAFAWRVPSAGGAAGLVLLLAALLPYLPSLGAGFAFDDGALVQANPAVHSPDPWLAWTTGYWPDHPGAGLYRPWVTFSYWWNARLAGPGPAGFHAVNLLLHAAVVLVLWTTLRRLFPGRETPAFVTAILFAVHPIHSEVVASVVGRAESWAALWVLLAYRLALGPKPNHGAGGRTRAADRAHLRLPVVAASGACFALALLSKESAAGLLLLPFAHAVLRIDSTDAAEPARDRLGRWGPCAGAWTLALLGVLVARQAVLGSVFGLDRPSLSDNALAHVATPVRVLSALGFQWILVLRTLFPWRLAADYSYPQLVPGTAWMAAGVALLVPAAILATRAWRSRDRETLWGAAFLLSAGAITANLLAPVGTVLAERLAYLPSAGSLWLLVVAGGRLQRILAERSLGARAWIPLLTALWIASLAVRSALRTLDWRGDLRLFQATVADSPRSAKAWSNLAVAQLEEGRVDEALSASERALSLLPDYPAALEIRATALVRSGRAEEAVPLLRRFLADPRARSRSLVELGNAYLALSRGAPAETAFAAAARVAKPDDFHPAVGLASAYALQERWPESEAEWRRAASLAPGNRDVRRSWAYALWRSGAPDRAEAIYREILDSAPGDGATLNDYAWFLLESRPAEPDSGRSRRALELARRAVAASPDSDAADTLLEALRRVGGCAAARAWLDSLGSSGRPPEWLPQLRGRLQERCNDPLETLR